MNRRSLTLAVAVLTGAGAWSASAQTLTHRYSFNDTAGDTTFADSVGGADGSLNNTAVGANPNSASLDGSKLQFDGTGGYATLPASLINGYTQLTVEFWADVNSSVPTWTRIFSFGDQDGGGNKSSGVDFCPFAGGDYQNLDYVASGNGAYANSTPGIEGLTNSHVTVVVDPVNNLLYYYNGTKVVSIQHNAISPLSGVSDTFNLLGRSLYDIDPPLTGAINEFRIYQGVLSTSSIALNDASGPGVILSNPGTIQALHFSSPVNTLIVNQSSQQILTGDFSSVSNLDLIAYGGATYSSLNSGVATINTNGVVKALAPGAVKVVATYGALTATNTLTVVAIPPALVHRYNFNGSDASDSVGGANGTLMGTASVSGGQLVLDGSFGSYVSLPGNAINIATNNAVTFEAWATFGNPATWAYLFGFGNTNNGGGVGQIAAVPCAENGGYRHWGITENFGGGRTPSWSRGWNNLSAHITCVVDPPSSTISIYRDGVLEIAEYDASAALSNVPTNYAFIGRSFYDADPYLSASMDEFRIYSGALSPAQIALTHRNGPNVTNLDVGVLSSIVVVATNYPAYASLVPPVILANYANVPNFNLLPTVTAGGNATLSGAQGLIVTSSETNIVSVNAQDMLTTHQPGTVTLSASYGGKSSSATIQVRNRAVLTHRYSFNTDGDASDSVGGANGTLQGAATVSSGQLQLTGGNGDYLDLPPGMLTNYNSVTIDSWANLGAPNHWARLWEFTDVGAATQNEFYFSPGWNGTPNANFYNAGFPWGANTQPAGALGNALYHVTCTYGDGYLQVYTNGVLEASVANIVAPASSAGTLSTTIGHSPFADPGINGSVDEFRIYNGRLSPDEILAADLLGPNQMPSTTVSLKATVSGGNIVLSWPLANAGFTVQASSSLVPAGWTTLTNVPALAGNTNWQVTVPKSGGAQFFRLWR